MTQPRNAYVTIKVDTSALERASRNLADAIERFRLTSLRFGTITTHRPGRRPLGAVVRPCVVDGKPWPCDEYVAAIVATYSACRARST